MERYWDSCIAYLSVQKNFFLKIHKKRFYPPWGESEISTSLSKYAEVEKRSKGAGHVSTAILVSHRKMFLIFAISCKLNYQYSK